LDGAARFSGQKRWVRPVDPDHPGSRGNYRMLQTPPDEPIVEIQRVDHESRVHLDIETDDIVAEVCALDKARRQGGDRLRALGGDGSADRQRFCCRKGYSVPVSRRTLTAGLT